MTATVVSAWPIPVSMERSGRGVGSEGIDSAVITAVVSCVLSSRCESEKWAENDVVDAAAATRSLKLVIYHPGLIWTSTSDVLCLLGFKTLML